MSNSELGDRLEELFSEIIPEPGPEEEKAEPLLEEAVVASLLEGRGATGPALAEPEPLPASPSVPAELEARESEGEIPPTTVPITPGKRRSRVLNLLLYGVVILGGVPLVFLLVALIGQKSVTWSGFHTLYCAAYTVAVVVTLIQWLFNSSLTGAVREAEEKHAEAARSQMLLEERVAELAAANAQLQRRALQFQTAAQVCHAITPVLDLGELVQEVVDRIRDRFALYYVGLFLIEETDPGVGGQWAVLRAGTGEAGPRMLAQGHRLGLNSSSLVGRCIASGQARIALDIASAQDRPSAVEIIRANPLLPETCSEMALPLLFRGRVLGALDIHSARRGDFPEEDVIVLQMMADQVAVAIENAQVFARVQARLEELEELEQSFMREQRVRLVPERIAPLYERTRPDVAPLGDVALPEAEQAIAQRETFVQSGAGDGTGQAALVTPISLRGQVIGALGLQEAEGGRQWTEDEIALIEAIADQMALAIENARLIEETQRRAERERLLAEISARVRASTDVDTILRTAVRELGRALRASDGLIRLEVGDGADSAEASE